MSDIDGELIDLGKASAAGKRAESLKSEISSAIGKRNQTKAAYASKRAGLYQRWSGQEAELKVLRQAIVAANPTWATLNAKVCSEVFDKITAKKAAIRARLGTYEGLAADKSEDFTSKKTKLDAWLALDQWLTAQLEKIDNGIRNVQGLLDGPNQIWTVYLFWFVVQPAHQSIAPDPAEGAPTADPPEMEDAVATDGSADRPPCLPAADPDRVYMVELGDYEAKVDAAWKAYEPAFDAKQKADSDFKSNADDLAAEAKKFNDATQPQRIDQAAKDALKKP